MCTSWSALHHSLIRHLNRTTSEEKFLAMRQQFPDLAQFPSIPALMEHQHGQQGAAEARYRIIRVLVVAAQAKAAFSNVAQMIVIVALYPGLDAVLGRLSRGFPSERHTLPSELIARISYGIAQLDLKEVSAVSATLIRNVERDIRRDLIADQKEGRINFSIDAPEVEAAATLSAAAAAVQSPSLADWLVGLPSTDATLLDRVFRLGETHAEAGRALDLNPAAARKRVQRALQCLRSAAEK